MSSIFKLQRGIFFEEFLGGSVVKNPPAKETQEMQVQSLGQEDPLEEGMEAHPFWSSCLENSMEREEPGGLQCTGLQRVRQDPATKQQHRRT